MNRYLNSCCLIVFCCFFFASGFSQKAFHADENGYVSDPAFKAMLKKKGYLLCGPFENNYGSMKTAQVWTGKTWREIDLSGKPVLVDEAMPSTESRSSQGDPFGSESSEWDAVAPPEPSYSKGMRIFTVGQKQGLLLNRDTILPAISSDISVLSGNQAIVYIGKNYHLFYRGNDYKWTYSDGYTDIKPISNLLAVSCAGVWGLMTLNGQMILQPTYSWIREDAYERSMLVVTMNGRKGWIDKKGKLIIPPSYDRIVFSPDRNSIVASDDSQKLPGIDIYSPEGEKVSQTYNAFYPVGGYTHLALAAVGTGSGDDLKLGIFDLFTREQISDLKYQYIGNFYYGQEIRAVAAVKKEGKMYYGYIATNGTAVTPLVYEYAYNFSAEQGIVKLNGKYGSVDYNGNYLYEPLYDSIILHDKTNAIVKNNGKWGVVSTSKKIVVPAMYDGVKVISDIYILQTGKLYGFAGPDNTFRVAPKYTSLELTSYGFMSGERNGKRYWIDFYGNEAIVP